MRRPDLLSNSQPGNALRSRLARPAAPLSGVDQAQLGCPAIALSRLNHQCIGVHGRVLPHEMVAKLGAMQGQDYSGGLWAIGLRTEGTTEADVENAIAGRQIVRTWAMRGTLQFIAADDLCWMNELLGPRNIWRAARRFQHLELDEKLFARSRKLISRLLRDGPVQRDTVTGALNAAGISTASLRGHHILWRHAQEGHICFGAREGKQHTLVLVEGWTPSSTRFDRDSALAELAWRYFSSRGPATLRDFIWWSGLPVGEARKAHEGVAARLVSFSANGENYWMLPLPAPTANQRTAYLLPGFDEYLLGYADRNAMLEAQFAKRIVPGGNGVFRPTIVVQGRVVGTWKRGSSMKGLNIAAEAFRSLTKAEQKSVATAAGHYGEFCGFDAKDVTVAWA